MYETVSSLVDARNGATLWLPHPVRRITGYQNTIGNCCRSDGSVLTAFKDIKINIQSGKCEGSKILTKKKVLINGKEGKVQVNNQGNRFCHELSVTDSPGSPNNPRRKGEVIGGEGVCVNATTFNFNGGYMAGVFVVINGGKVTLIGTQGGRAAVPHIRDCGLAEFLEASAAFESVHDRKAMWSQPVLVLSTTSSSQPQQPATVRTTTSHINMSQPEAAFATLNAEVDHYGRPLPSGLTETSKVEKYTQQGIETARQLQERIERPLVPNDLQQHLTSPFIYALDTGTFPYVLHIIMPAAESGAKRHIMGDSVTVRASENLFLKDLNIHGAQELKLASGGYIHATTTLENKILIDKDGWVTTLQVHKDNNLITGGIVKIEAEAGINFSGTDVISEKDMLLTSGRGEIVMTGVTDEEKATRSQTPGFRDLNSYDGGWDYHAQQEQKTAQHARQSNIRAGGNMHIKTSARLTLSGVNLTSEMKVTLEGQTVKVETPTEEYTYTRESISESGSRLRERFYRDKSKENASESKAAAPSRIDAGVLTVIAQICDLVGVQVALGELNDQAQKFRLLPVIEKSERTSQNTHYHTAPGFAGVGTRTQQGNATTVEKASQPVGSSVDTQIAYHGDPKASGGELHVNSSKLKEGVAHVNKTVIMETTPKIFESNTTTTSKGMNQPMSASLLPPLPSTSVGGSHLLEHMINHVKNLLPTVQAANQIFGAIRLLQENKTPLMLAAQKLGPTVSWTQSEQNTRLFQSQDVPAAIHWGVVNFKGKPAFHIKGYVDISTLTGALGSLSSEPLRTEQKLEVETHTSTQSVSPLSLGFSWSEDEYKRLQQSVTHIRSQLNIGSGDLIIEGNADFFGIQVKGQNSYLAVGGKKTLRSAKDIYVEKIEQSHEGFSVNLGALLPTLLGGGTAITGNTLSYLTAVTPSFGGSASEVREEKAVTATLNMASGNESSPDYHNHFASASFNIAGNVLDLLTTGAAAVSAGMELFGHMNHFLAPAKPPVAQPETQAVHENHQLMLAQESAGEPLSPAEQRVVEDIVEELTAAEDALIRSAERRVEPASPSVSSAPSQASVEAYCAIYTKAAKGQISSEVIEQAAILDYYERQLDEIAARQPQSAAVQKRYEIAKGEIQVRQQGLAERVIAGIPDKSIRKVAEEALRDPNIAEYLAATSTPEGQRSHAIKTGAELGLMLVPGSAWRAIGKVLSPVVKGLTKPVMAGLHAVGADKAITAAVSKVGSNSLVQSFLAKVGMGGIAKVAGEARAVASHEGKALASTAAGKGVAVGNAEAGSALTYGIESGYWNKTTQFKGNKIYQRNDLIDSHLIDDVGRTNLERMKQGFAPLGPDNKPINLHHMLQTPNGPIAEVAETFHQTNNSIIHINPSSIPSGIHRPTHDAWRKAYWKMRANDFS